MVTPVVVLNLFFVPVVALWLDYKERDLSVKPTVNLLLKYMIFTVVNAPMTKVGVFLLRKMVDREISIDSGIYTVLAILSSIVLGFLAERVRTVSKKLQLRKMVRDFLTTKKEPSITRKQKMILAGTVNLFFVFTMVVFTPFDVFFSNQADFNFSFSSFWWIMASCGLFIFSVVTVISLILPSKWFVRLETAIFSVTLCSYIQRMFLNQYITSIVGERLDTGEHPTWRTINLGIWIFIIICFFLISVIKIDIWKKALLICSAGLIFVQASALVFLLFTENLSEGDHLTTEGLYEVSSKNNIIVFLLDYYDRSYFDLVRESDKEFYDNLDGFTYFDNTASVYSRSYPSNTYLLTGVELDEYYVEPPEYCVNKAFSESRFLPDLMELGFGINLYTGELYLGDVGKDLAENYSHVNFELPYFETIYSMLKCSFYFDMPYAVKPMFWLYRVDAMDTVSNVYQIDDAKVYNGLIKNKLSVGEEEYSFRYIHMFGGHDPYTLNEECERVTEGVEGVQQFKGCMNIVYEYLNQMKALGLYDSSTIIITSDHGTMNGDGRLSGAVAPILFVKPAYSGTCQLKISHAPVSHRDLFPTIMEAAGGNYSEYGTPIFSIGEDEERTRVFHYTQMIDWKEEKVIDYNIPNDIKDFENWREISSKEVYESMYAVAK